MTAKKFPCKECGARGRQPHADWCSIGQRLSAAARKGAAARNSGNTRRRRRVTTTNTRQSTDMINRVSIIVDRSGSMRGVHAKSINVLNRQIDRLKNEAQDSGQSTYLSIYHFGSDVKTLIHNRYIHSVPVINASQINISGMTAMFDAAGEAMNDMESLADPNINESNLVIVITDGFENSSYKWNKRDFINKMRKLTGTDKWTFVFNGPPNSRAPLNRLGVPEGNIQEWETTDQGLEDLSESIDRGLQTFYRSRRLGATSTKKFFETDLSSVSTKTLKSLTDLSRDFKSLPVNNADPEGKEWQIRPFVEDRIRRNKTFARQAGHRYISGRAYYELTKAEDVQDYKDVLIQDRATNAVYGGTEARNVINMPTNGTVRVRPGNHANYRLYIESTSVNRKLVRGTYVMYLIR